MTTRDQFIEKTCQLLELQGYHATGLNQIIKESGSPKGSLYYHFPGGKEELATEAIRTVGEIILQRIRENLAQIDDPAIAIRTFIMNIAMNVERSGFSTGGPITAVALETAATSVRLRDICHQLYSEWSEAFQQKLEAGGFEPERAGRLATLIITSIEGGVILCRTSRSREPLESVAQEIGGLLEMLA